MHQSKPRGNRFNPVLGEAVLYIHSGKWWQASVELTPGRPCRLDLQVEGGWKKADPELILGEGASFVTWAKTAELGFRKLIVEKLFQGDYYWIGQWEPSHFDLPDADSLLEELSATMVILQDNGCSSWDFQATKYMPLLKVHIWLKSDQTLETNFPGSSTTGYEVGLSGPYDPEDLASQ